MSPLIKKSGGRGKVPVTFPGWFGLVNSFDGRLTNKRYRKAAQARAAAAYYTKLWGRPFYPVEVTITEVVSVPREKRVKEKK